MRIIAGEYKGRILSAIPASGVRPATDRVKSTIYNMLQNRLRLQNAKVLDLFAGSGSLGFEALSRGAGEVVFVESNAQVIKSIKKNAEMLKCEKRCDILQAEAMSYLQYAGTSFDLIFADPPYVFEQTAELPPIIFSKNLLNKDGFLIIEHTKHTVLSSSDLYLLSVQKEFGQTRVSFFTHKEPLP